MLSNKVATPIRSALCELSREYMATSKATRRALVSQQYDILLNAMLACGVDPWEISTDNYTRGILTADDMAKAMIAVGAIEITNWPEQEKKTQPINEIVVAEVLEALSRLTSEWRKLCPSRPATAEETQLTGVISYGWEGVSSETMKVIERQYNILIDALLDCGWNPWVQDIDFMLLLPDQILSKRYLTICGDPIPPDHHGY
ncbi:hypothetical protein [Thiothrix lacustris]|uniref:hypothetical protein n=1 Tax=Thiothrix lacustris TaxID=525917 RepID=UPI0027E43D7C|nr:hypothetical protein [Thiothrix lacustris]WMP18554.1 hypothetical protein RCS87_05725 [Thiothrix lacustris]